MAFDRFDLLLCGLAAIGLTLLVPAMAQERLSAAAALTFASAVLSCSDSAAHV
jgi:hypothetical protein